VADYKGKHVVCDMILKENVDISQLMVYIEESIKHAKMNVVDVLHKPFDPHGDTVVWILSESHFSLHTYPESCYISVDCYTCGEEGDPHAAINYLRKVLQPKNTSETFLLRGMVGED